MATDIRNPNPGVWSTYGPDNILQLGPDGTYGDIDYGAGEASGNGNAWDWILENGDDAVNVIDSVLCAINPKRYGCRPQQGGTGGYVVQSSQNNTMLIVVILLILVLIVIMIFKK